MLSLTLALAALLGHRNENILVSAVPLNEVVALGTHNSFHLPPSETLTDGVDALIDSAGLTNSTVEGDLLTLYLQNRFEHPSLEKQLQVYNVRSLELDVYDDPEGGRFKCNSVARIFELQPFLDDDPVMDEPGFKVFHKDGIDQESTCKTLDECLSIIKQWSGSNPTHFPIVLRAEIKRRTLIEEVENSTNTTVTSFMDYYLGLASNGHEECPDSWPRNDPPVTAATVQAVLDEFVSVLGPDNLVTPDTLRGDYPTVQAALECEGAENFWPDVDTIRGKFIIVGADMNDELRELYGDKLHNSPAHTRLLISSNTPATTTPDTETVFVEYDPSTSTLNPLVATLNEQGYFTIVRVDKADQSAATAQQLYDDAVASGANLLVTDFIVPQTFEETGYTVSLPCSDDEFCDL